MSFSWPKPNITVINWSNLVSLGDKHEHGDSAYTPFISRLTAHRSKHSRKLKTQTESAAPWSRYCTSHLQCTHYQNSPVFWFYCIEHPATERWGGFLPFLTHVRGNNTFREASILQRSSFPVNTQRNISPSSKPWIHYEQTRARRRPPLCALLNENEVWERENIVTHLLSETKKI